MKKQILSIASSLLVVAALFLSACSDGNDGNNNGPDVQEGLVIKADKEEIAADGLQQVKFTVELDGQDVTANSTILDLSKAKNLYGNTFKGTKAGEYKFAAIYNDSTTEDQVSVKLTEADPIVAKGDFKKRVFIMDFTGDWCINCPFMFKLIDDMKEQYGEDKIVEAMYHREDDYTIPVVNRYFSDFRFGGVPAASIDFRPGFAGAYDDKMDDAVYNSIYRYTADAGIRVVSQLYADRTLEWEVSYVVSQDNDYSLQVMIVEDNIKGKQTTYDSNGRQTVIDPFYHDNVVRHYMTDFTKTEDGKPFAKGDVVTEAGSYKIPANFNIENCRIIAYVCCDYENLDEGQSGTVHAITNVVQCKVGASKDIEYEK